MTGSVVQAIGRRRGDLAVLAFGSGALAVTSIASIHHYAATLGVPFFDWTFYSGAVQRWRDGGPIYPGGLISTLGSAAGTSYAYPPASVPLMLPFASWPLGAILWETTIVGLLLFGLLRVVKLGWPDRPYRAFGIALAVMALLEGVLQGIALANVNLAIAGVVGLLWASTRDPSRTAALFAVVKVFPISLAAPSGPRALAQSAAIALVICTLTLPLVGQSSWSDYVHGLMVSTPLCDSSKWMNASLACLTAPIIGVALAKWVGLAVAASLVALALVVGRTFIGFAAATFAILAPATELHAHYLSLVFVLAVIGLAELNARGAGGRASRANGVS